MEKNYKFWVGITFLVLLLVFHCADRGESFNAGAKKELKRELKSTEKEIDGVRATYQRQLDSIRKREAKKDKVIAELQKENKDLEQKAILRQKKLEKQKQQIATYDKEVVAEVLREYYQTNNVVATEKGVELQSYISNAVVDDLAEKDACFEDLEDKNKIIENKDKEIAEVNDKVLSRDLLLATKQIETQKLSEGLDLAKEINKKSEKQITNLKVKGTVAIIVTSVASFLLGQQLAK